jgi:hypothetical protein
MATQIWIPHHVGLEFQRNRLKVIAEQSRRVSDARRAVTNVIASLNVEFEKLQLKKRQSLIDPDRLIGQFETVARSFYDELDKLPQSQQKVNDADPIKEKLEELFDGRIGRPPTSQEDVDDLYREAVERYKRKIPPGYEDAPKDKNENDAYTHRGITYQRKFGDFVIWRQILSAAKETRIESIVLVTDDGKDDWWWKIEQDGSKTIGPRPELVEEASRFGVDTFLMYSPENFLKFSGEVLRSPVSEATLAEVRDVSQERDIGRSVRLIGLEHLEDPTMDAVERWLMPDSDAVGRSHFPDLIAYKDGKRHGYELVLWTKHTSSAFLRMKTKSALLQAKGLGLTDFTLVFVILDDSSVADVATSLFAAGVVLPAEGYNIIAGRTLEESSGDLGFIFLGKI